MTEVVVRREDPVVDESPRQVYHRKKAIFRVYQVIWYVLGVIEVLLLFRMIFKALDANAASGFVSLIYAASNPLAMPFAGMFKQDLQGVQIGVLLVAMLVYAIVAYALVKIFQLIKPASSDEVERGVG